MNNQGFYQKPKTKKNIEVSASAISWKRVEPGGGGNFKARKLIHESDSRMKVSYSAQGLIFIAIFFLLGLGVLGWGIQHDLTKTYDILIAGFLVFLGGGFVTFSVLMCEKPAIFDKKMGYFWVGSSKLTDVEKIVQLDRQCRLSDVVAIQTLTKFVDDSDGGCYTHEINLVLKNGHRLSVIVDGDERAVIAEAKKLAVFLEGLPIFSGEEKV